MPSTSMPSATFTFEEKADLLSPRTMLELPRAGSGVVNPAGDLVLVSVAQWSFGSRKYTRWLNIVPVDGLAKSLRIEFTQPGEVFWLDARTVGVVRNEDGKETQSLLVFPLRFNSTNENLEVLEELKIGELDCVDGRDFVYSEDAGRLVFAADVYPDTSLATVAERDKLQAERGDSALVYDSSFVRHWDAWTGPKRTVLFSVALIKTDESNWWKLGEDYVSPMKGTEHASPVYPFGGIDDFSASKTHLVYSSRDPTLPKTFHTRRNIYIAPLDGSKSPRALTSGRQGETHAPSFSPDGGKVAWLQMEEDGNDADSQRVDRSPDSLAWTSEGQGLLLTAHEQGKAKVFLASVPSTPSETDVSVDSEMKALTTTGMGHGPQPLLDGRVVFSRSTMLSPFDVFILDPKTQAERQLTSFAKEDLRGMRLPSIEEMWFKGAEDRQVHSYVLFPPDFKTGEEKKWPVIMLIHGGPQAAWNGQWSTRFNPAVWASQGYVMFVPNFTGSTGFGQAFVDAVAGDWGGAPFVDMREGYAALLGRFPEIDPSRAAAVGGSWGGYAVNLIQGHPEWGFGFKALVCHDGEFDSTFSGYSVDEQFIFSHEWGGRPWEKEVRSRTDRMSPHKFVEKWGTPQLWLHGSNDFRVSEAQAIAAFHALQQRGIPGRLVVFPDENHFVLKPGNSLKWHWEVFRFLEEYVKG